jgi:hypothetical protein
MTAVATAAATAAVAPSCGRSLSVHLTFNCPTRSCCANRPRAADLLPRRSMKGSDSESAPHLLV